MEERMKEEILLLITKIEIAIAKLEEHDKIQYQEELNNIKERYEEELKDIKEHELTLRPESLILQEYSSKIEELLNIVTIDESIKSIKDFCSTLELTEENLKEKLVLFESIEEEYKEIKNSCNLELKKELITLIHSTLYKFIYNEIKFYAEDSILQSLTEEEKIYLTKILIDEIAKINNKELEELLKYYEFKNENILNKDVIDKLVEIELIEHRQERKIVKQDAIMPNETKNELAVKKKESFSEKVSHFFKGTRKIPAEKFMKKNNVSYKKTSAYVELDFSVVNFDNYDISGWDFSNTSVDINPQRVYSKSLKAVNLTNIDMSDKNFDGVKLCGANLTNTNADINPQEIYNKDLRKCILKGIDFQGKSFDEAMIYGTNFEGALNLDIDFQKLFSKSLHNTNLRGHNLSEKNLDYLNLKGTNLENTNANIDPQKTIGKNLTNTILRGLNLSHKNFSGVNLNNTDFSGANIYGANFKGAVHLELANFDEEQKKYLFERHGITLDENAKDIEKIISAMEKNTKVTKNDKEIENYRKISDELIDKYNEILLRNNNKIRR